MKFPCEIAMASGQVILATPIAESSLTVSVSLEPNKSDGISILGVPHGWNSSPF